MGNQKSKQQETITINNNNKEENNMDFGTTIKLDAFFIFCMIVIVFIIIKVNKYFKNYIQKKAVVQV